MALAMIGVLAGPLAACDRAPAAPDETAAQNLRAAEFFMTSNARREGVQILPSGVQYKVVRSGPAGGESPDSNDLVRVDYEGTLTDGTVFDSSFQRGAPAVFTIEGGIPGMSVVEGWREVLQHMTVGDEWIVYLPPEKGYGEDAAGEIPPNSVLVFRMKLLDIARTPGGERGGAVAQG
ncbi:MAG: FKBP-type peptidyl-prolyl cis-trans isomerase [Pseudomonadota bacterium]|nr:FKBP-type peptidyl-prolyl cis-trans isomerase [Pseudomonadota bacterium]